MIELPEDIHEKITEMSEFGNLMVETYNFEPAIRQFIKTLELVPDPKQNWEVTTWLYVSIGDCHYEMQEFKKAKNYLFDALNCPNSHGNPFIYLRLGQCLLELSDQNQAADFLCRAYMLEGKDIFNDEAPKYFEFLKTKIEIK